MDEIKISPELVVSMDDVAKGVRGLRITFVNVFALTHADTSWTLIDAGVPFCEGIIRRWAEKHFHSAPNAIVLTHGHFDHVSAARGLADEWEVPIFAHPLELPYLTGEKAYPAPNAAAGGGLMALLSPIYPRDPIDLGGRLRPFTVNGAEIATLPGLPNWEILHTPGHTPGHVSFFRAEDKTLLVGDAFCTTKPESFFEAALIQDPEMHGPPSYFTSDWNAARRSVERLAQLKPVIVAPGHGKPLSGTNVPDALSQLAAAFEEVAVPENQKGAQAQSPV
jgi:glyoxylase-like metal-dependent hydrolase (beta-lactamase superfamily II)